MPDFQLDSKDPMPLNEQVAAELRRAIRDGECRPGERLPPARDLAAVMKVNHNTVLRAMRTLREEGLLEFRRGRGITVAEGADSIETILTSRARELLDDARKQGYRSDEVIGIIKRLSLT